MRRRWIVFAAAGALLLAAVLYNFLGPGSLTEVAHESVRYELRAIGTSIYEYHASTGTWPSRAEDLDKTSLATRSPYWKATIDNRSVIIVWHDDLKPDPRDNARVVLAYHNRGLIAEMGRHWVCWGDLRTEYITDAQLRTSLGAEKK